MTTRRTRNTKPKSTADPNLCHWAILQPDATWKQCPNDAGHGPFESYCKFHSEYFQRIKENREERNRKRAEEQYTAYSHDAQD